MQTTPDTHNPDSQPCECRTATGQVDMCSLDGMYHCVRGRGEHAVNCRLSRKRGHLAEAGGSANFVRGPLLSAESHIWWLVVGVLFLGLKDNAACGGLLTGLHTTQ